jgi:hypothetical protein
MSHEQLNRLPFGAIRIAEDGTILNFNETEREIASARGRRDRQELLQRSGAGYARGGFSRAVIQFAEGRSGRTRAIQLGV